MPSAYRAAAGPIARDVCNRLDWAGRRVQQTIHLHSPAMAFFTMSQATPQDIVAAVEAAIAVIRDGPSPPLSLSRPR